ncbi:MAG: PQQ-dependent sugar dehydrogenase [Rubricoccaceae bacterium]
MRVLTLLGILLLVAACQSQDQTASPLAAQAQGVQTDQLDTEAGPVAVMEVAGDLEHPWAMTFLPDGRMLVTERPGRLRIVNADGTVSEPVAGTPEVRAARQGGLLDVALDPDFETNSYVYLSYSKPGPDGTAATALGRGVMQDGSLTNWEDLFVQEPFVDSGLHFGSRIAFSPDGHLFLSTGDRGAFDPAQDLGTHIGKMLRLNPDGSVPEDNPFVGQDGAQPEIWAYGLRNAQSLAFHPETGELWEAEFGPRGGDELNRIEPQTNYGWPLVSWGMHYDGRPIPDPPARPELTDAVTYWTPVISPSGMAFYMGDVFPEWTGSLMISSLSRAGIVRVELTEGAVSHEETIELGARVREVEAGPDGHLYALTDESDGRLLRLDSADG